MNNKRIILALIVLLSILISSPIIAIEKRSTGFMHKHFAGGRIGAYTTVSDETPPDEALTSLKFTKSSIYAEFFYAHRIIEPLAIELSVGIYSRGDVEYDNGVETSPVKLYPIWLSAKFYPFYKLPSPLHFFIQPGAGIFYGVHETYDYNYYVYEQDNKVKFTYMLGGGVDFPLGQSFGLTASFKYIPVKFNKPLAEVEDYTGWTLAVGAGYIFGN
ncbi:MAG: hypothetical protein ABIJ45_00380 [Candidatus Zixiibacteriota bacterium]